MALLSTALSIRYSVNRAERVNSAKHRMLSVSFDFPRVETRTYRSSRYRMLPFRVHALLTAAAEEAASVDPPPPPEEDDAIRDSGVTI